MKKRLLLIFILAGIALSVWSCDVERSEPINSKMAEQLSMLPQNANGLMYINAEKIIKSKFFNLMMDSAKYCLEDNKDFKEMEDLTGFNIRKDAREAYFTYSATRDTLGDKFLAVVTGRYNETKIMEFIHQKKNGSDILHEEFEGIKIYYFSGKDIQFCFPDQETFVFGHKKTIRSWIEKLKAGAYKKPGGKWFDVVKDIKYKNGIYFTMDPKGVVDQMMSKMKRFDDSQRFEAFKSVENISFSMDMDDKLRFDGWGNFGEEETAELFFDSAKGLLATLKLSVSGDRDAVDVINKVKIAQKKESVQVKFEITGEDARKLISRGQFTRFTIK